MNKDEMQQYGICFRAKEMACAADILAEKVKTLLGQIGITKEQEIDIRVAGTFLEMAQKHLNLVRGEDKENG